MRLISMKCSQCGAALPPRSRWSTIDCSYCGARMVLDNSSIVRREEYSRALSELRAARAERATISIGGARYRLENPAIRGESSDVHPGWRPSPLEEAVFIKILRAGEEPARLEREFATLTALQESAAKGTEYFSGQVPEPVAFGVIDGGGATGRPALVLRRVSGFVETLADIAAATNREPRHAVWIWKRLLEILDWTHRSGRVHAAVVPRHVVIHARDHGVMLAGWSASLIPGARLPELWSADESFYPRPALDGAPFDERADLVMAARCVAFSLTGKPDAVGDLPEPLAALLASWIAGTAAATDAWALRGAVDAAARKAYGAPKYVELKTPAWS